LPTNEKTGSNSAQNSQNSTYTDVGRQIFESIHSSPLQQGQNKQITVRLNPPELGSVSIKIQQEQDSQITGLLEVSKSQTRFELEQAMPQLIRHLADCGIQIRRLDVVLSDGQQSSEDNLKDQFLPNDGSQYQDSNHHDTPGDNFDGDNINQWLIGKIDYQESSGSQQILSANNSINMLI
jgi:flagellar hook-length control protein FliK